MRGQSELRRGLGAVVWIAMLPVALCTAQDADIVIPNFENESTRAGLSFTHVAPRPENTTGMTPMFSPGVAIGDINRDGYLDVFVNGGKDQNAALFINRKDGTFANKTAAWGIDLTHEDGLAVNMGDIDGNGYLDLIVGACATPNRVDNHKLLFHSGPHPQGSQATMSYPIEILNGKGLCSGRRFRTR